MNKLERRKRALSQLENQLQSGLKPNRGDASLEETITKQKKDNPKIKLTEKDKERIKREIDILKTKIPHNAI